MLIQKVTDPRFIYILEQVNACEETKPSRVFAHSCELIAHQLKEHGYGYNEKKKLCTKTSGIYQFSVRFETDHSWNKLENNVQIVVYASVESAKLKEQCKTLGIPWIFSNTLASGQLGNFGDDHKWLNWNLSDKEKRPKNIGAIYNWIQRKAFPVFEKFENPEKIANEIVHSDLMCFSVRAQLEVISYYRGTDIAKQVAIEYVKGNKYIQNQYQEYLKSFENSDVSGDSVANDISALAYLVSRF